VRGLHALQRVQQILDQVVGVLEAAGEPHHSVADAERGARLRRQPLVRGGRRVGDQPFGVAANATPIWLPERHSTTH
jgi:hypothetical protein